MKYFNQITVKITLLLVLILTSCDSFIEVDMPQSQLTGTSVFTDVSTATAAVADIYARMREGGVATGTASGLSSLMSNYSNEFTFFGTNTDLESFNRHTLVPSNYYLSNLWNTTYGQIYAANAVIEGLEKATAIKEIDRNTLKGEALFIRAYLYFNLVNLFGDIPYATTTDYATNATLFKATVEQVNQKIIDDLLLSEKLLPENYPTEERVRANKSVVIALLARVYLYNEEWEQAALQAEKVIVNPLYRWEENPATVFLKNSPSIIFSLHPGIAGLNTKDARTFVFSSGPPSKSVLSNAFLNNFETGDLRKKLWTRTITNGTNSWTHTYKYKKTTNTGTSQEYTILFRLAEQYLIRAEARAQLGNISGAQQDVNKIRNRAGLANTTATTPVSLVGAVLQERKMELFTEQGLRWFDLKRTGLANSILEATQPNWKSNQIILPLPESELLLNNNLLPQNTGY